MKHVLCPQSALVLHSGLAQLLITINAIIKNRKNALPLFILISLSLIFLLLI
jgi:hypothetical protein